MVYVEKRLAGEGSELVTAADVMAWLTTLTGNNGDEDTDLIRRAFETAREAHAEQRRASGEPYIQHSLAVADILVSLKLDPETVAAAILHDVVEDTEITLETIEKEFGAGVARLVDGVTKMQLIDFQSGREKGKQEHAHAESLRKLLLAMAEDVRVVLIKLADRLHNMRTLSHLPEAKQRRIARETLDIYAPLANRLGIWQIKWELEDLAFRYLEPATYKDVARFLDERRVDRERYIEKAVGVIRAELDRAGIKAEISGRPKHLYSIWKKMRRKGLSFNELYDVRAVRIIVEKLADCYAALGVVHTLWRHIPREFDDYIATPKANNYQSIHTAVIGPEGKTLEVQIRTREMHEHSELGVASHWRYKEGARGDALYDQKIAWLRQLLEWKDESTDAGDFIDRFKSEVFQERVYVLTPQGDVMDLPQGATPLDFAYHIHTEIGNRCRGAKVDGRIVPLTYELKSGEQVEILTTARGAPSRDWLNPQLGFLRTSRARAKARQWFKQQNVEESIAAGRTALDRELHRLGVTSLSHDKLANAMRFEQVNDLLAAIGRGDVTPGQLAHRISEVAVPESPPTEIAVAAPRRRRVGAPSDDVHIHGVGNLLTHMARCCRPAPGDAIIGFITRGKGVTIHRRDCTNILKLPAEKRARLIEVEWSSANDGTYPVEIEVEAIDRSGLLRDITSILANEKISVDAVNTLSNKRDNTARMSLTLEIADVDQLSRILNRISQLPNVLEAHRQVR